MYAKYGGTAAFQAAAHMSRFLELLVKFCARGLVGRPILTNLEHQGFLDVTCSICCRSSEDWNGHASRAPEIVLPAAAAWIVLSQDHRSSHFRYPSQVIYKVGLESSSTGPSFPADYPKPVPLAVEPRNQTPSPLRLKQRTQLSVASGPRSLRVSLSCACKLARPSSVAKTSDELASLALMAVFESAASSRLNRHQDV